MMNQLKGNVRNDSAKRAKFKKIQENLELNGWKKQTTGCSPSGSCSRPMEPAELH
jgi:hypothetical protein